MKERGEKGGREERENAFNFYQLIKVLILDKFKCFI